jgi:hypothetical protein
MRVATDTDPFRLIIDRPFHLARSGSRIAGVKVQRRSYRTVIPEMQPYYRMLHPYLGGKIQPPSSYKKKNRNGAKNGLIPSTIRLAAALRYFADVSPHCRDLWHLCN